MYLICISVLCVLNQKNHQKGNDRRAGINDQLPGVVKSPKRATGRPDGDAGDGEGKGWAAAGFVGKPLRYAFKHSFLGHVFTLSIKAVIYRLSLWNIYPDRVFLAG